MEALQLARGTLGPRRFALERSGLSTYIPARASPGLNVVGVVKRVRCSSCSSGLQTVAAAATERRGAVIDGKSIAGQIRKEIAAEVATLKESLGKVPGLAVVLVGTRKDSETYVRSKKKACEEVGFASFGMTLPEDATQEDVVELVKKFNDDPEVHGILVQLPLPKHINEEAVLGAVSFEKDVDGFHPINVGSLCMQGRKPLFVSCTPKGCIELLVRSGVQIKGKRAVVIGRSNIVGTPAAQLLQRQNATVTVVHSNTPNPAEIVKEADIVIAAVGKAELVRGDWLKPGAVVIDVGINAVDDPSTKKGYRLVGDVCYEEASQVASLITPVPGGVGPMTIAMLLSNTLDAAKRSFGVADSVYGDKRSNFKTQGATEVDASYMRMCVELAKEAAGKTSPNPIVGCVIVKDGRIVGRGFHPKAGEPHAEVFALREAGHLAKGATAYVSLEPCNHHGRTPPCSQAFVKAKLKRVVVGVVDPNPQVAGKGINTLRSAGIEVVEGVEETLCRDANEVFIHGMLTGQPFVTLRYSMSMDGGFLGNIGLSNAQGGLYSKLLQENDAVIVTEAAVFDDPILLSSEPGATQPLRVIIARSLDLPVESKVFDTSAANTLVLADQQAYIESTQSMKAEGKSLIDRLQTQGVDVVMMKDLTLEHVLNVCHHRGATSVLLDSRGPVFSGLENFLGQQAVKEAAAQKVVVQVAPIFLGENRTEPGFRLDDDLIKLERVSSYMVGQDVVIAGYFPQP